MNWGKIPTGWGTFYAAWDGRGISRLLFPGQGLDVCGQPLPVFRELERQLGEYLAGERRRFDVPISPSGTQFQLAVWRELLRVPYGQVITYGELARRIGRPRAARAVGGAVGANPLPILIPCHRVVGAGGTLGGFGPGLPWKRRLLELEGVL